MIETFNARDIRTKPDSTIIHRAKEKGVLSIVGSDAHLKTEIGRACMLMDTFTGPQDFLRSLASAETICRKSPLWVHLVTKILKAYKKRRKSPPRSAFPSC